MSKKGINWKMLAAVVIAVCIMGCSERADNDSKEPEAVSAEIENDMESSETIIDYPFAESLGYKLTLAKLPDLADEYELVLYDKEGEVLQQIPCGVLKEPIEFSYDKLAYHAYAEENDLEVFSGGSTLGLLFLWDDGKFSPEAVEIPRYDELNGRFMIVITEEGDKLDKQVYLLNKEKRRVDKIRYYNLNRDTGQLVIRDDLENVNLYDGIVRLDDDKNPENTEYIDMLFENDMYIPGNYEEQAMLPVWVGEDFETEAKTESGFEKVQNEFFGNPGYTKDYESREALLKEFGFWDKEPMYQYFDQYGNLQLEIYMDDAMENICGIIHEYAFNSELKKVDEQYGFTLRVLYEGEWEEKDKYSLKTHNGQDGTESEDWITDYDSNTEYCDDGKVDFFKSTGKIDGSTEESTLISINFVYRNDGTLYYRDYGHSGLAFETFLSSLDSYYDEKERVVYERGYITHGHVEYYYIYEDESDKPAYCLYLDHNLGYVIPQMVRYR